MLGLPPKRKISVMHPSGRFVFMVLVNGLVSVEVGIADISVL